MNQRFLSVLIFAFLVAAGASMVLYRLMTKRDVRAAAPTAKVVVASRNLALGVLLKEGDLKLADWTGNPPPGASGNLQDLVGRGVIAAMYENEPVLVSRLAPKGGQGGLSATIPQGMRAVAVRVNEVVGVAGFVTPGTRVDVLISGNGPSGSHGLGTQTRTILQNIEVLSAGQNFQKDSEGKPVSVQVVNLLVTPQQAEVLSLAATQAQIQLVLRNPLDTLMAETQGANMSRIFGGEPPPRETGPPAPRPRPAARATAPAAAPAAPPKPEPFVVEMIHGSKRIEAKFEDTAEVRQ